MLVMVTEAANVEEQLASMKTTLERLAKESLEKDTQIKHQNKQIGSLMKKLEKQPFDPLIKARMVKNLTRSLFTMKTLMRIA